jgi:hypothetical protein
LGSKLNAARIDLLFCSAGEVIRQASVPQSWHTSTELHCWVPYPNNGRKLEEQVVYYYTQMYANLSATASQRGESYHPIVKGLVRAETAFEGNNNKGPLKAGGAHAGPQAPRLLQGKERREGSPYFSDSPKDCGSYLNKSTPRHCTRSTPHHHTIIHKITNGQLSLKDSGKRLTSSILSVLKDLSIFKYRSTRGYDRRAQLDFTVFQYLVCTVRLVISP